jgi:DNA-binding NarL/FixJ family response regulator
MDKAVVVIVDKQSFFRAGVRQALSAEADLELLDCAPNEDLLGFIEANSANVVLLDIDFPSMSGLELCRKIVRYYPSTRVVVLSPNPTDEELFEVIKTGAVAYMDKNTSPQKLVQMVRQADRGEYPINDSLTNRPRVAEQVLRQFQAIVTLGKGMETVAAPLTARETQILSYIAEGNSNKQIARILQISEQTIKNHVSAILRKLNANDRAHAVVLAIRHGWISADEKPEPMAG